ncbi:MAG: hypothetical protein ACJ740_06400 [Gaiellales bacterium]|jgi:hypothetical protein
MRSYLYLPTAQLERLLVEAEYALRQFEHYSKTVPGLDRLLHEQRDEVRRLRMAIELRKQEDAAAERGAGRGGHVERMVRRLRGARGG